MHNEEGDVIYIGKSKNIKKRINQHFTNTNHKSKKIQSEVSIVTYEASGNELLALLKENEEIKKNKPKYNRALKKDIFSHALYKEKNKEGYLQLKIGKADPDKKNIITFTNLAQAKSSLEKIVEEFGLCEKLTGLHKTSGSCFNYSIKKCEGACVGLESAESYNQKVQKVIDKYSYENKNMLIIDRGREVDEKSVLLIEDGDFQGMGYFNLNFQVTNIEIIKNIITPMQNNRDTQHIIQSYLRKRKPLKILEF
ncbi:GIY-YIG nuclease family protein [Mesonia maritima]